MTRGWGALTALVGVLVLAAPIRARAFCGFYVAGADRELFNEATKVVLLREGTTTVLSMQNDYRGEPEDFALVVPVPVVLDEDHVRTLPREVFDRIDGLAAPRLVEYWEQDPCADDMGEGTIGLGNLGTIGHGAGGGSGYGRGAGQVVVEAEFAVGEYDIVILSAEDSGALDVWLRDNGYHIPEGADEALRPYVDEGMKFFVARVDASRVSFEEGRAVLSPLRVHYESEQLRLPVRLGLLSSNGTQDLLVHVLARNQRYELANYDNAFIPTNLDVSSATRERFGEFYAALFDATRERHPGAVITEYAWRAQSCDPCPGPTLTPADLATLGADVAPATADTPPDTGIGLGNWSGFGRGMRRVPQVRVGSERTVSTGLPPEVVRRVIRRHLNEVRFCYEQQLNQAPGLDATVTARFRIEPSGATAGVETENTNTDFPAMDACIASAVRRWTFPQPEAERTVSVSWPFVLRPGDDPAADASDQPRVPASQYASFVLSRLHHRYERDGLDEDLVFRAADAVVGGREAYEGEGDARELEHGASESSTNNFQARYAIRHPWEGEVACENPRRGNWGGPPIGERPETSAAHNTAQAPRGGLQLAEHLVGVAPELALQGTGTVTGTTGDQEPEAEEEPQAPAEAEVPAAAPSSGCGCRASAAPGGLAGVGLLLVLGLFVRRRRG